VSRAHSDDRAGRHEDHRRDIFGSRSARSEVFLSVRRFLLHDVGTGDGLVIPMEEHFGRAVPKTQFRSRSAMSFQNGQNKVRTAPLWDVRLGARG
jgi:hypothetical protein